MNTAKLRGKIAEKGFTVKSFCEAAEINRSTFDRKMGGRSEFDREEIEKIIRVLELTDEETKLIFFTECVA